MSDTVILALIPASLTLILALVQVASKLLELHAASSPSAHTTPLGTVHRIAAAAGPYDQLAAMPTVRCAPADA